VKRRIRNALGYVLLAVSLWMVYDNVFSDDAPIRDLAEKAACTKKKCDEQHGMTKEDRRPWNQTFDYAWRDGALHVECHRAFYVVGTRVCSVE
jgi:hypothetical protein